MDDFTEQFFEMGEESFKLFCNYMNEKNALPISLN